MVLHVTEDDRRCAFVQGQIEVPVSSVVAKRVCIITSKSYNLVNFRHVLEPSVIGNLGKALPKEELKQVLFNQAPVTCRYVYIQTMTDAGKSYEGVVRSIYTREADEHPFQKASVSSSMSATIVSSEEDNDSELFIVDDRRAAWSALKRRPRSDSLEELDGPPPKVPLPRKTIPYTFGDAFCGVGGASEGAAQAGLSVSWGLDNNEAAIQAYAKNHLGAKTLSINAHDFGDHKDDSLRVDVLHLSPPCCYWSPAQ
jgi:DNA (cytosine-5)-methyltransferase 1